MYITSFAEELAVNLAKQFEGCKSVSYKNPHDVWTIGYGHTKGVTENMTCSQEEADDWLWEDLYDAVSVVEGKINQNLTDHQAAALVDFVYNLGQGNFDASTLLKDIDAGDLTDVPDQLLRWVHDSSGEVLPGLVSRRQAEVNCFNTPDDNSLNGGSV